MAMDGSGDSGVVDSAAQRCGRRPASVALGGDLRTGRGRTE
jgi:hypothetical protein